jgi:RNA 3'-terminal phosphate cyclase-like protein
MARFCAAKRAQCLDGVPGSNGVKGTRENGGSGGDGPSVPEDVALKATHNLLEEIYRGGCVDSSNQYLAFVFMVLNQKDVSRVLSGILSPFS